MGPIHFFELAPTFPPPNRVECPLPPLYLTGVTRSVISQGPLIRGLVDLSLPLRAVGLTKFQTNCRFFLFDPRFPSTVSPFVFSPLALRGESGLPSQLVAGSFFSFRGKGSKQRTGVTVSLPPSRDSMGSRFERVVERRERYQNEQGSPLPGRAPKGSSHLAYGQRPQGIGSKNQIPTSSRVQIPMEGRRVLPVGSRITCKGIHPVDSPLKKVCVNNLSSKSVEVSEFVSVDCLLLSFLLCLFLPILRVTMTDFHIPFGNSNSDIPSTSAITSPVRLISRTNSNLTNSNSSFTTTTPTTASSSRNHTFRPETL